MSIGYQDCLSTRCVSVQMIFQKELCSPIGEKCFNSTKEPVPGKVFVYIYYYC